MNACCWDMGMFQDVIPAGKRDCELSRAVQACVQRRSGPSCGPARPSPWEGLSVDVPPGSQPAGQSWGVRRILRRAPPPPQCFPARDMLQMWPGSPACCLIAPHVTVFVRQGVHRVACAAAQAGAWRSCFRAAETLRCAAVALPGVSKFVAAEPAMLAGELGEGPPEHPHNPSTCTR